MLWLHSEWGGRCAKDENRAVSQRKGANHGSSGKGTRATEGRSKLRSEHEGETERYEATEGLKLVQTSLFSYFLHWREEKVKKVIYFESQSILGSVLTTSAIQQMKALTHKLGDWPKATLTLTLGRLTPKYYSFQFKLESENKCNGEGVTDWPKSID